MLQLLAAVTLLIHAEGPLPADPRPALDAARALAVAMGCASPSVYMEWRGGHAGMQITVECRERAASPEEDDPR